jgi:hypothetical protein
MTREVQLINSNHCLKEKKKRERKHRMTLTCLDSRFIYLLSTDCFFFSRHFCQNDILHFVCFVLYCIALFLFDYIYYRTQTNKNTRRSYLRQNITPAWKYNPLRSCVSMVLVGREDLKNVFPITYVTHRISRFPFAYGAQFLLRDARVNATIIEYVRIFYFYDSVHN